MDQTHPPHYLSEADMAALIRNIRVEEEGDWDKFLSYAEELHASTGDVLIRLGPGLPVILRPLELHPTESDRGPPDDEHVGTRRRDADVDASGRDGDGIR